MNASGHVVGEEVAVLTGVEVLVAGVPVYVAVAVGGVPVRVGVGLGGQGLYRSTSV